MKPTVLKSLVVLALATIFILNCGAFARTPALQARVSSSSAVGGAAVASAASTAVAKPRDLTQPVTDTIKFTAATIGFLPADLLTSIIESKGVELGYSLNPSGTSSKKKGASQENESDRAALAKDLRNPVSSLARILFESNLDFGLAANREGYRYTMNLEPVIPIALNKDWNLISRTRVPLTQQDGVVASEVQSGVGDILQSFFLSPSKTKPIFWGAGATLLIPIATDTLLGTGKFALGPALAVGKSHRAWTIGALARHIWSVAGHRDRPDVRSTYVQPFVAYTTGSAWSFSLDTESTYDWMEKQWSVPVHLEVTKILRAGGHPVSVGAALTCWAASPSAGPQACGVRFMVTPLFPAR